LRARPRGSVCRAWFQDVPRSPAVLARSSAPDLEHRGKILRNQPVGSPHERPVEAVGRRCARHAVHRCRPSGAGKSSIVNATLARDPQIALSISFTSRAMRPGK
jgi:hypothetical protein